MSDTNVGVDAGANAQTDQTHEVETKARRLGWVPKEEFRGDPTRWKPAEDFIAHGEEILPILRQNNDVLHDRLTRQERDLAEAKQVLLEMREFNRRNEQRIRTETRAEVEADMRAAVETADTNRFDAAQARMRAIEAPPAYQPNAGQAPAQPPYVDPVIVQWVSENPWFNIDPGDGRICGGGFPATSSRQAWRFGQRAS